MYKPFDHPKAYNNCILDDTLLYVAVDYAGMEVLNISDTSKIALLGWWNPYNAPNNNWFSSPVHTNEMQFEKDCQRIYLASGKSDMLVIDVSNPRQPDSCNFYGGVSNILGTWGIGLWKDQLYLSYICALIPFSSNWTGVKILSHESCQAGLSESNSELGILMKVYPNPTGDQIHLDFNLIRRSQVNITLVDFMGRTVKTVANEWFSSGSQEVTIDTHDLTAGLYFVRLNTGKYNVTKKIIVNN
jgi:hypothetical protein